MKKKIWTNKARSFKEADTFDREFWQKQKAQARFAATWKTISVFYKIRGMHGYKLRLQRSVQNIKQAQS